SDTYNNLVASLDAARHPIGPIVVQTFSPRPFKLAATVAVDPTYYKDEVFANLANALVAKFSFDARNFGQAVTSSEIYAAAQSVAGVVAIDISKLYFDKEPAKLHQRLPARSAWLDSGGLHPAELLTLSADAITLDPMSP
ncbi:MAG: putative baseplate assembly protein, partial [Verrucomicrobiota bacterium]|nr:putative baseplate assembly protein [Verrucomicrobiota bacterium]